MGHAGHVGGEPTRVNGLWRHADFRRLWIGETISQFGTTINQIALPLVAILALHASVFEVGLLTAFQYVAFLLIGLPAGAWVDRMRIRWVLIVNDIVRAAAIGSIPLAQVLGVLSLPQLYIVALAVGTSTVFFDIAYQSYLPQLVRREELVEGNAKLQASESVSQVAGPGLGGLIIQALSAPYALLIDAASFLWSASWVGAIAARTPKPERKPDRNLRREVLEGLRFVLKNPMLRAIAACTGIANLFANIVQAVVFVLLARQLHLSPGVIGGLSSIAALGGLIGSLMANRLARRFGQGPTIWGSMLVTAPLGFMPAFLNRDWTLGLYVVTELGFFAGVVVYNITQVSLRQALCPPELLGRMNATMRFLIWGSIPLGGLLGGVLGSILGVRGALLVAAIGGTFPWLFVFFSPLRRLKEVPAIPAPRT